MSLFQPDARGAPLFNNGGVADGRACLYHNDQLAQGRQPFSGPAAGIPTTQTQSRREAGRRRFRNGKQNSESLFINRCLDSGGTGIWQPQTPPQKSHKSAEKWNTADFYYIAGVCCVWIT